MRSAAVALLLLFSAAESLVPADRQQRLLGGPGPPPGEVASRPHEADAALVRNEVTRLPRGRETTRELEVPVITGEYEDDNKPSKWRGGGWFT